MPIYQDSRYENSDVQRVIGPDGVSRLTIMPTAPRITPVFQFTYHTVMEGDRIDVLAYQYFGDAELWWVIADHNPQWSFFGRLPVGLVLRIPSGIAQSS